MSAFTKGSYARVGSWSVPGQTQTAGTLITQGIPAYRGGGGDQPVLQYGLDSQGIPNWMKPGQSAYTVVSRFGITAGSTAHVCYFLRPLNWAVVKTAVAVGATSIVLKTNPGTYSTAYKYPLPASANVSSIADLTPANTHYYAVQLADGTWFFDLISAWTAGTLTVTTTTAIPTPTATTGVGILAGAIFFLLGSSATTDPATGMKHPSFNPNISVYTEFGDPAGDGIVFGLHPGDPLYFYDINNAAADTVAYIAGYYGKLT